MDKSCFSQKNITSNLYFMIALSISNKIMSSPLYDCFKHILTPRPLPDPPNKKDWYPLGPKTGNFHYLYNMDSVFVLLWSYLIISKSQEWLFWKINKMTWSKLHQVQVYKNLKIQRVWVSIFFCEVKTMSKWVFWWSEI